MNAKFKLELRASYPDQCREWVAMLEAKRSLHNVDRLAQNLDVSACKTRTFQSLLFIKELEQDQWMNNNMNDIFENMHKESHLKGLKDDCLYTIIAARICLEEFISVCEECSIEYQSRNPAIIANCRYVQVYLCVYVYICVYIYIYIYCLGYDVFYVIL